MPRFHVKQRSITQTLPNVPEAPWLQFLFPCHGEVGFAELCAPAIKNRRSTHPKEFKITPVFCKAISGPFVRTFLQALECFFQFFYLASCFLWTSWHHLLVWHWPESKIKQFGLFSVQSTVCNAVLDLYLHYKGDQVLKFSNGNPSNTGRGCLCGYERGDMGHNITGIFLV